MEKLLVVRSITVSFDYRNLLRSEDLQCCTRSALSSISTSKRSSSCSTLPFRYCRLRRSTVTHSSVQDIDDRWCDGVGPLAECLTVIEVYCTSNSIHLLSGRYTCLILSLFRFVILSRRSSPIPNNGNDYSIDSSELPYSSIDYCTLSSLPSINSYLSNALYVILRYLCSLSSFL